MSFVKVEPFKKNLRPGFVGDYLSREHVLPGGAKLDLSTFPGDDTVVLTLTATANAGAVSLVVAATSAPIPAGAVMTFVDGGVNKYAKSTAAVGAGVTAIPVEALSAAIANASKGAYVDPKQPKRIHAGTPVFISQATLEGSAATGMKWKNAGGGVAVQDTDVVSIIAFDVTSPLEGEYKYMGESADDVDLLRKGTLIRVNHMYWSTLSDSVKAKIRAAYEVTVGAPGQEVAPFPGNPV